MKSIVRSIIAVVLGAILAMVVVMLCEGAIPPLFSLPAIDPNNTEALNKFVEKMPPAAFGVLLAGWTAGAFFGALVAAWVAGRAPSLHAGIIGALILLGTIAMLKMLPHPMWVGIAGVSLPIPVSLLAAMLVPKRPEQSTMSQPMMG